MITNDTAYLAMGVVRLGVFKLALSGGGMLDEGKVRMERD